MGQEPENTPSEGQEPAPEPKAEETPQSETKTFDADYVKKLRTEAAKYRTEAQEAKAKVEEYESANQSELEKLTNKLTQTEEARKAAESKLLRFEVATEKQIPTDAVDLLDGQTREELEAKADKLLELVKSRSEQSRPDFDGGARESSPEPKTPEQAHNDLLLQVLGVSNQTP